MEDLGDRFGRLGFELDCLLHSVPQIGSFVDEVRQAETKTRPEESKEQTHHTKKINYRQRRKERP